MVGAAMQVGLRLESPHPWNQGVRVEQVEPAEEPGDVGRIQR